MSDWQPGDLALCVKRGPWWKIASGVTHQKGPTSGQLVTVAGLMFQGGVLLLDLREWPALTFGGYAASRFKRIPPLTDEEREQFASDLNIREPQTC